MLTGFSSSSSDEMTTARAFLTGDITEEDEVDEIDYTSWPVSADCQKSTDITYNGGLIPGLVCFADVLVGEQSRVLRYASTTVRYMVRVELRSESDTHISSIVEGTDEGGGGRSRKRGFQLNAILVRVTWFCN
jgi:hypothetical protein